MKKTASMAVLLMVIMLTLSACTPDWMPTAEYKEYRIQNIDYEKFKVTEAEVSKQHQQFKKIWNIPSEKDQFQLNRILIVVYPFANEYPYAAADFTGLGCTGVTEYSTEQSETDKPARTLMLQIDAPTKRDVIRAIHVLLETRHDVREAAPIDWMIIN